MEALEILLPSLDRYISEIHGEVDSDVHREMMALGEREGFPYVGPVIGKLLLQITLPGSGY